MVELEDHYNMVDEQQIEPDYYIDRKVSNFFSNLSHELLTEFVTVFQPDAKFIPDSQGQSVGLQLNETNNELYDFGRLVEPVLSVLVGKALEHARCELILKEEQETLQCDKSKYKIKREAMLQVTQRLEGERGRRNGEIERVAHNQKAQRAFLIHQEQREIAKDSAKQLLTGFKRDNLAFLSQIGLLRNKFDHQLNSNYLPSLFTQVMLDFNETDMMEADLNEIVLDCINRDATSHKTAI